MVGCWWWWWCETFHNQITSIHLFKLHCCCRDYDEADEYCPHCDNHYVIEAKTPKPRVEFEAIDPRLNSNVFLDPRVKQKEREKPTEAELEELAQLASV